MKSMRKCFGIVMMLVVMAAVLGGCKGAKGQPEWKKGYITLIDQWESEHSGDSVYGYKLINLDSDEVPELVLYGESDWGVCKVYSYENRGTESIMEVDGLGVDGSSLYYYEGCNILVSGSWMSGAGGYNMNDPYVDNPLEPVCSYWMKEADDNGEGALTTISYKTGDGKLYEKSYDGEEYQLADIPEKTEIENTLGIADLSAMVRIDSEDNLLSYDAVIKAINEK